MMKIKLEKIPETEEELVSLKKFINDTPTMLLECQIIMEDIEQHLNLILQ